MRTILQVKKGGKEQEKGWVERGNLVVAAKVIKLRKFGPELKAHFMRRWPAEQSISITALCTHCLSPGPDQRAASKKTCQHFGPTALSHCPSLFQPQIPNPLLSISSGVSDSSVSVQTVPLSTPVSLHLPGTDPVGWPNPRPGVLLLHNMWCPDD